MEIVYESCLKNNIQLNVNIKNDKKHKNYNLNQDIKYV